MTLHHSDLHYRHFRAEHLAQADHIIWSIYAWDHTEAAPKDVADLTQAAVADLAEAVGAQALQCVDYDTNDAGVPYYAWWIRLPATEHANQDPDGVPLLIGRIHDCLCTLLPAAITHWEVSVDADDTRRDIIAAQLRTTYADLITALEETFLHRRTGGADELHPQTKLWHEGNGEDTLLVGDYAILLAKDPADPEPYRWLVLTAGIWPGVRTGPVWPFDFRTMSAVNHDPLEQFNLDTGQPVLPLPRPRYDPVFTAKVISGSVPRESTIFGDDAQVVGSTHQWTARDPKVLAANILRDLNLLYPGLLLP